MATAYQQFIKAGFQWNHDKLVKEIIRNSDAAALSAAYALADKIEKNTPVLAFDRKEYPARRRGKYVGKSWTALKRGALKNSVRVSKSKYRGGGAAVLVGDYDTHYWRFVELGAPKRKQGKYPKKRYIYKTLAKEKRKIKQDILGSVSEALSRLQRSQATGRLFNF